jgi:hypothetical protein
VARRDNPVDQEQQRQAVALYAEGLTQAAVGARLGLSVYRVGRILRAAGVKVRRGFGAMDAARRRAACAAGGKAAHAQGVAHEFTSEEAAAAGAKGGRAAHERGTGHRFTPEEARAAGRKGGRRAKATPGSGGDAGP